MIHGHSKDWDLSDYPKVNSKDVQFPKEITIAYATCSDDCGALELIVLGGNTFCSYCKHKMATTLTRNFRWLPAKPADLEESGGYYEKYVKKVKHPSFPGIIPVAYGVCGRQCENKAFIVDGQTQICEHCRKNMFRTEIGWHEVCPTPSTGTNLE